MSPENISLDPDQHKVPDREPMPCVAVLWLPCLRRTIATAAPAAPTCSLVGPIISKVLQVARRSCKSRRRVAAQLAEAGSLALKRDACPQMVPGIAPIGVVPGAICGQGWGPYGNFIVHLHLHGVDLCKKEISASDQFPFLHLMLLSCSRGRCSGVQAAAASFLARQLWWQARDCGHRMTFFNILQEAIYCNYWFLGCRTIAG